LIVGGSPADSDLTVIQITLGEELPTIFPELEKRSVPQQDRVGLKLMD
jgi:hypothetical protein